MATLSSTATTQPSRKSLDFLPFIDMKSLSQSELRALSVCSASSSSLRHRSADDSVIPTIDRTIFNESAGSRRQTYSRPSQHHHRHRVAGLLPKATTAASNPPNQYPSKDLSADPDRLENQSIIKFLKQFLSSDPEFQDSLQFDIFSHFNNPVNFIYPTPPMQPLTAENGGIRKRKRGRKPKVRLSNGEERERALVAFDLVNKKGEIVDWVALANVEDPFGEELRRRTAGMEKEEDLFGFFRELEGQWCSRRRKRKIVDASEFGDHLPMGWKLLLGLKRKEGRAWVYCRRYISPSGQHFVSSKEVSAYLQSLFGPHGPLQAKDPAVDNTRQSHLLASESHSGATEKDEAQGQCNEHTKEVDLLGFENLAEVQIHDLFECHKCNMKFDEKDTYLQHLLSLHQRTTRRYRLGSSVGDGVIIKDGKYECQFCHKIFHERRRYNGHVGIHVRNYVRGIEDSPAVRMSLEKRSDSPSEDELPTRISKMDALIEIAQNSIHETSTTGLNNESIVEMAVDEQNAGSNTELLSLISDRELNSDSPLSEEDDLMVDKSLEPEIDEQKYYQMVADENKEIIDDASDMLEVRIGLSDVVKHANGDTGGKDSENIDHLKHGVDKSKLVEIEIGFQSNNCVLDNGLGQHSMQQPFKENLIHHVVPDHPIQMLQPPPCSSLPNAFIEKGESKLDIIEQKHDKVRGFEGLRMEEIEQVNFIGPGQDSVSLPKGITQMEGECDSPVHFESEVIVNTANGQQLITECVWCGVEFSHEAVDTEVQSDSVGYMCPTCKAKISGRFDVSGSDCS